MDNDIDQIRTYSGDMRQVVVNAALQVTGLAEHGNAVPLQLYDLACNLMTIDEKTKPSEAYDCLVKRLEEYKAMIQRDINKELNNGII